MAFTAREVILTFRGQNYLSSAIRRVGRDVGQLSKRQQLTQAVQQNQINMRRLQTQKTILENERQSIQNGSRALTMQSRFIGLKDAEKSRQITLARQVKEQISNQEMLLKNETKLQQIQAVARHRQGMQLKALAPKGLTAEQQLAFEAEYARAQAMQRQRAAMAVPPEKALPPKLRGLTPEQLKREYTATLMSNVRQNEQLKIRNASIERYRAQLANMSVAEQKVAAQTLEMGQREAVVGEQTETANMALEKQLLIEKQLAMQTKAMPWERWHQGALAVEHVGRVIQMFGLIGGAAMGYMASQAAQFGTSMTLAATQSTTATNNTTTQIVKNSKVLEKSVLDMLRSGKTAAQPSDLTDGLYQIFSGLSFSGSQASQLRQGVSILEQFNKVYTANYGQVKFNDIVSAGINLINNFALKARQLPRVLNTMQASVRFGAMGMGQFVGSLSQVVPAFRAAHYSFQQMGTDIAFVSRLFPQSLRTGTTGLARLTEMFARPNVISGIRQQLGVNIAPRGQLEPINQIIKDIIKARPGIFSTSLAITNFFKTFGGTQGTVQARRVLAGYVQEMPLYDDLAKRIAQDNKELARSQKAMAETPQVKWETFKNQMRAVTLELGAGAIPAFKGFARPILFLINAFNRLSPHTQKFIGELAAIVTIGGLVVGTFLTIAGAIGAVYAKGRLAVGFAEEGGILAMILGGRGKFASEAGFIQTRFALIIAAIGALTFAIAHWHTVMKFINDDLGGMTNAIRILTGVLVGLQFTAAIRGTTLLGRQLAVASTEALTLRTRLLGLAGTVVTATILLSMIPSPKGKQTDPNAPSQERGQQLFEKHGVLFIPGTQPIARWVGRGVDIITGHGGGVKSPAEALKEQRNKIQEEMRLINSTFDYAAYKRKATILFPKDWILNQQQYNQMLKQIQVNIRRNGFTMAQTVAQHKAAEKAAKSYGTTATYAFESAYLAYIRAKKAAKTDPQNFQKQLALQDALTKMQGVATKQQMAAATKSATAAANIEPAWKAATDQGFVATAQYIKLYNAANNAQKALQKDPTMAHQRAYIAASKALQNYVNNVTAANDTIQKDSQVTYSQIVQNVESMYQNLLQQNTQAMGTLTQGPWLTGPFMTAAQQFGYKPQPRDYLKDARAQLHQFTNFNRLLGNLRRRGAPEAMIQQLQQLGPQSIEAIRGINRMSQPELRRYFGVFRRQQQAIHRQTMRDLNHQLHDYLKYGRKVGLAMAAGVRQESPAITKAIDRAIRNAFGNIGRTHHGGGRHRQGGGRRDGGGGNTTNNYTTNNYGSGKDAETKARHHRFRQRQRHNQPHVNPSRN